MICGLQTIDRLLQAVLLMPSEFLGQEEYFDY
jgi:hypothetical protein